MSNIGKQADFLHGIPRVANNAERDARFPSPDTYQRVENAATGYIEEWGGTSWAPIIALMGKSRINVDSAPYSAKGDGSTDDSASFTAAIAALNAAGGGVLQGTPGKTYGLSAVTLLSNVVVDLSTINYTKVGGTAGISVFSGNGAVTGSPASLTANANIGDTTLTVGSVSGFTAGDYVLISDLTYKYSTSGQNLEIQRVGTGSAGTTLNLAGRLDRSYATASSASVQKLNAVVNAHVLGGVGTIPVGTAGGHVYFNLAADVSVRDLNTFGHDDMPGVRFDRCKNPKIIGGHIRDGQNVSTAGHGYGFLFNESCIGGFALGVTTTNIRENPVSNNAMDTLIVGCRDYGAYDSSFNTHGTGVERCTYLACKSHSSRAGGFYVSFSGNNASDQNITVDLCEVYNAGSTAMQVAGDVGKEPKHVRIIQPKIMGFGVVSINSPGIFSNNAIDLDIDGGVSDGLSGTNALQGVYTLNSTDVRVRGTRARNVTRGFQQLGCTDLTYNGTRATNCSGNVYISLTSGTRIKYQNVEADATTYSFLGTEEVELDIMKALSADRGDANVTLNPWIDAGTQYFNTPLTTGRTVTATSGFSKAKWRVVRSASATGASTLTAFGKALTVGQWVEAQWNGAAYVETASGSL